MFDGLHAVLGSVHIRLVLFRSGSQHSDPFPFRGGAQASTTDRTNLTIAKLPRFREHWKLAGAVEYSLRRG
jgi:hypothetical protein